MSSKEVASGSSTEKDPNQRDQDQDQEQDDTTSMNAAEAVVEGSSENTAPRPILTLRPFETLARQEVCRDHGPCGNEPSEDEKVEENVQVIMENVCNDAENVQFHNENIEVIKPDINIYLENLEFDDENLGVYEENFEFDSKNVQSFNTEAPAGPSNILGKRSCIEEGSVSGYYVKKPKIEGEVIDLTYDSDDDDNGYQPIWPSYKPNVSGHIFYPWTLPSKIQILEPSEEGPTTQNEALDMSSLTQHQTEAVDLTLTIVAPSQVQQIEAVGLTLTTVAPSQDQQTEAVGIALTTVAPSQDQQTEAVGLALTTVAPSQGQQTEAGEYPTNTTMHGALSILPSS